MLSTVVATGSGLGYGPTKVLSGLAFSLGLILVVIAGAELFTGNNLITISWVSGQISLSRLLRNWGIVSVGNLVGALSIVLVLSFADWWEQADGALGGTALSIAAAKASLPVGAVVFRGVLANALVCLAVWLASAGRTVTDKILAARVRTVGRRPGPPRRRLGHLNVAAATLGNVIGGALLVGLVYWFVYLRSGGAPSMDGDRRSSADRAPGPSVER